MLGVSRNTLYAYVSRRGIRSIAVEGTRERMYWRSDIDGAKRPKGRPRHTDVPVQAVETSLSFQNSEKLYYRGEDVTELADTLSLEEVAALLWQQPADVLFTARVPRFSGEVHRVVAALADASGSARAIAALPLVESANPRAFDFSSLGLALTGADVVRSLVALMLKADAPSPAPIHEQIGTLLNLSPAWIDFVRRLLVLSADHLFEASTNAVRSVASIGVSPYRSVTAGLLLIGGRRTQMGRFDTNARLLNEICDGDPEEAIMYRVREGSALPGFGYGTYTTGDPRSWYLLRQLDIVMDGSDMLRRFHRAIDLGAEMLGLHPDFALIAQFADRFMAAGTRVPLFAIGRSVGWIAHSIEQIATGEAMRPASVYTGPLPGT